MAVKARERKPVEWWIFIEHKGQRSAVKAGSRDAATAEAKEIEAAWTLGNLDLNPPEAPPPVRRKSLSNRHVRNQRIHYP